MRRARRLVIGQADHLYLIGDHEHREEPDAEPPGRLESLGQQTWKLRDGLRVLPPGAAEVGQGRDQRRWPHPDPAVLDDKPPSVIFKCQTYRDRASEPIG